jgi:N6-adenosine-specific RNA methylase IME4
MTTVTLRVRNKQGGGPSNHNAILPMFSPMSREPDKKYRTIVADPPWDYREHRGDGPKGAGAQYPCMKADELLALPVGQWAEENSHLYLWVTNAFVVQAHQIAKAWGFEPRTIITWVKGRFVAGRLVQHIGLGSHFRTSTEHIVFCVRGKLEPYNRDIPTAFIAPRTSHSEKPQTFYDLVEHVSPGPYLDVFARKQRFNWDTFGDEAFNFGTTNPAEDYIH